MRARRSEEEEATAARSADESHEEELDVICRYVEKKLGYSALRDSLVEIETLDALTDLMRHMRRHRTHLDSYLGVVFAFDDERLTRIVHVLGTPTIADGRVSMSDQLLLADLTGIRSELSEMIR